MKSSQFVIPVATSGLILILLAGPASAFTPVQCTQCPNTTNKGFTYFTYNELPAWKDNRNYYINNLDNSTFVVTNGYVQEVAIGFGAFNTEPNHDFLLVQQEGGPTGLSLTGSSVPLHSPISIPLNQSPQGSPIRIEFIADYSVSNIGARVESLRMCCSSSVQQTLPSFPVEPGARYTGLLFGTGDVVYFRLPVGNEDETWNLVSWGPSTANFDLYVQCAALPTSTSYHRRARSSDSEEFLQVNENYSVCPPGNYWVVALVSSSGLGQFNFVPARMKDSEIRTISVGYDAAWDPDFVEGTLKPVFEDGVRRLYGYTEGQIVILVTLFYNQTGTKCENGCGGDMCDVCIMSDEETANHACNVLHAGPCHARTGPMEIYPTCWDSASAIAHELSHLLMCDVTTGNNLDDEYVAGGAYHPCGHSVMDNGGGPWGTLHNYCVFANDWSFTDHCLDGLSSSSYCASDPVWSPYHNDLAVVDYPTRTPDNTDYGFHDFNGWLYVWY